MWWVSRFRGGHIHAACWYRRHDVNEGWLSSTRGKALVYHHCADAFRDGETQVHSFTTYVQLASIDGVTLQAPEGQHDDLADAYALAIVAHLRSQKKRFVVLA